MKKQITRLFNRKKASWPSLNSFFLKQNEGIKWTTKQLKNLKKNKLMKKKNSEIKLHKPIVKFKDSHFSYKMLVLWINN